MLPVGNPFNATEIGRAGHAGNCQPRPLQPPHAIVLDLGIPSGGGQALLERVVADSLDPLTLARERGYAAMEQMLARAGAR